MNFKGRVEFFKFDPVAKNAKQPVFVGLQRVDDGALKRNDRAVVIDPKRDLADLRHLVDLFVGRVRRLVILRAPIVAFDANFDALRD